MKSIAMLLGGCLGIALGDLAAEPIFARIAPTQVTWDAASCPSGEFTITTTATSLQFQKYTVTSQNVRLPAPKVIQEFPNLPSGFYSMTAIAQRSGQTLNSSVQTVEVGGEPGGPTPATGPIAGVRRRPAGAEPVGFAIPRGSTASPPPTEPRSSIARVNAPPQKPSPAPTTATPRVAGEIMFLDDSWSRIEALDTDGDGAIDLVRIELVTGQTLIWRISRQILPS